MKRVARILATVGGFWVLACTFTLDMEALDKGCLETEKVCDGACVALNDPDYGCRSEDCSPCPTSADGEATCSAGECAIECNRNYKLCDGDCVAVNNPDYGCSEDGCGPACRIANGRGSCVDGDCQVSCNTGYKLCDGECVSTNSPEHGCAIAGSCAPCYVDNASLGCNSLGQCAIDICDPSYFANCNDRYEDGCEVNTNTSLENCGDCDFDCNDEYPNMDTNAQVHCTGGQCAIRLCYTGWGDCNEDDEDGCETDIRTSFDHCGQCNNPCEAGETCVSGDCVTE